MTKLAVKSVHLETERIIMREWLPSDQAPFSRMNADPLIMEYFPRVLDEAATAKLIDRFQDHFAKHGFGMYALENKETKEFMGFAGLGHVRDIFPFGPAVEMAWRLEYEYWGKGFATEAAHAILNLAFNELNLKEVVAFSVYDNSRAIHMMEKLGMKHDKKGDFDYPKLPKGHPLGCHVLYRLKSEDYKGREQA